jgi:hypothetical protein
MIYFPTYRLAPICKPKICTLIGLHFYNNIAIIFWQTGGGLFLFFLKLFPLAKEAGKQREGSRGTFFLLHLNVL